MKPSIDDVRLFVNSIDTDYAEMIPVLIAALDVAEAYRHQYRVNVHAWPRAAEALESFERTIAPSGGKGEG